MPSLCELISLKGRIYLQMNKRQQYCILGISQSKRHSYRRDLQISPILTHRHKRVFDTDPKNTILNARLRDVSFVESCRLQLAFSVPCCFATRILDIDQESFSFYYHSMLIHAQAPDFPLRKRIMYRHKSDIESKKRG